MIDDVVSCGVVETEIPAEVLIYESADLSTNIRDMKMPADNQENSITYYAEDNFDFHGSQNLNSSSSRNDNIEQPWLVVDDDACRSISSTYQDVGLETKSDKLSSPADSVSTMDKERHSCITENSISYDIISECGTELISISSTLDSPDRSEVGDEEFVTEATAAEKVVSDINASADNASNLGNLGANEAKVAEPVVSDVISGSTDHAEEVVSDRRFSLESRQVKFWFQNRRTQMKLYCGILMLVLLCVGTVTAVPTPLRPNVPSTTDTPIYHMYLPPPPPPPSPPPPSPASPPSRHRPRPWVVTIIVVSILGALGSGGGIYLFMRRRNRMTEPQPARRTHSIEFATRVGDTAAAVRDAIGEAFGGAFGEKV